MLTRATESDMGDPNDQRPPTSEQPSLLREIGSGLKSGAGEMFRWVGWGALIGALLLGAVGVWYFGAVGLAGGAAIGAVLGGLGTWVFYLNV